MKKYLSNKKKEVLNKFNAYKKELLNKLIIQLQELIAQLTKSGIQSTTANYIYKNSTQQYISNIDNLDYPMMTNNVDNAIDFSQYSKLFRKLVLWKLNLLLEEENKFRWKNLVKLYGGNIGINTNISVGVGSSVEKSLADLDNIGMDKNMMDYIDRIKDLKHK